MSDITVTFKNETILTMDASGSTDLLTQGKYCEDDISISYVKPSGGGGIESGSFTSPSADNAFSIPLTNAPSHFVMYSVNADFGTSAAWNAQYFIWNSDDRLVYISHYSTSNYRVKTDAVINYDNGALTVSGLTDLIRAKKVYKWFAW